MYSHYIKLNVMEWSDILKCECLSSSRKFIQSRPWMDMKLQNKNMKKWNIHKNHWEILQVKNNITETSSIGVNCRLGTTEEEICDLDDSVRYCLIQEHKTLKYVYQRRNIEERWKWRQSFNKVAPEENRGIGRKTMHR